MNRKVLLIAAAFLLHPVFAAAQDTITAREIEAGVSDEKTELQQESWWEEVMAGKVHRITGTITDVEKGTFSGYWVTLDIGRDIMVRCGLSGKWKSQVERLRKGGKFTCPGYPSSTWTSLFGIGFSMDAN